MMVENDFEGFGTIESGNTGEGRKIIPPEVKPVTDEEPLALIDEDDAISLVDAGNASDDALPEVTKKLGGASRLGVAHKANFKRLVMPDGSGSTRCRFFHSKLQTSSLEYMENQINDWVDSDDSIVIKHIGHVIGEMTGKQTESNLIVCVWY